jgi:hypothetical protein
MSAEQARAISVQALSLAFLKPCQVLQETYSTVTDFAKLRGLSTSVPRAHAVW